MKAIGIVLLLIIVTALASWAFLFQVEETEYVVVTFFGDPWRIIKEPGLQLKWPWPVESVIRIDRRTHITSPEAAEFLTKDKKNVLVSFFVAWSVDDPLQFIKTVNDRLGAESRLQDRIRSEVGTQLSRYDLSELVTLAEIDESADQSGGEPDGLAPMTMGDSRIIEMMDRITDGTEAYLKKEFGIRLFAVRMKRLNFPSANKNAVFQRMKEERKRIATKYRSEGKEQKAKVEADADLQKALLLNVASRDAEKIRGSADAEATRIYAEAYARDPEFYEFLRSLEAYEKMLDEKSTIVLPADSPLLKVLSPYTEKGAGDE